MCIVEMWTEVTSTVLQTNVLVSHDAEEALASFVFQAAAGWLNMWICPVFLLDQLMCLCVYVRRSMSHIHTLTHKYMVAASCPVLQHASINRGTFCPPVASDSWSQPSSLSFHLTFYPVIWHYILFLHQGLNLFQLCFFLSKHPFCFWVEEGSSHHPPRGEDSQVLDSSRGASRIFTVVRHQPFWICFVFFNLEHFDWA